MPAAAEAATGHRPEHVQPPRLYRQQPQHRQPGMERTNQPQPLQGQAQPHAQSLRPAAPDFADHDHRQLAGTGGNVAPLAAQLRDAARTMEIPQIPQEAPVKRRSLKISEMYL